MLKCSAMAGRTQMLMVIVMAGSWRTLSLAQTASAPPALMHWCAQHCSTWVWVGDRYVGEGTQHPERTPQCGVTVESFTPKSVIMHRTDCSPYPGKAVLTGQLASDGNSIVNGAIRWTYHPCCGLSSGTFTAAWGAALNTVPGSDQERAQKAQPQSPPDTQSPGAPPSMLDQPAQVRVCTSTHIRGAMQILETQSIHDPSGAALSLIARAITGVDASSGSATILDSKIGTDGGRYTSKDPGSFVCRGLFVHGDVHISSDRGSDGTSDLTAAALKNIMATRPTFTEWFKVRPLQRGNYRLTLLPSSIQLSKEYSKEFTVPEL